MPNKKIFQCPIAVQLLYEVALDNAPVNTVLTGDNRCIAAAY